MHDDVPAVLAGDFNLVPTDFDIYSLRSFADNALVQPAPRAAFAQLVDMGWTDAIRTLHPDEPMFTFWSYLRNRWPRDAGLRLEDAIRRRILISPRGFVVPARIDKKVEGKLPSITHGLYPCSGGGDAVRANASAPCAFETESARGAAS